MIHIVTNPFNAGISPGFTCLLCCRVDSLGILRCERDLKFKGFLPQHFGMNEDFFGKLHTIYVLLIAARFHANPAIFLSVNPEQDSCVP